MSRQRLRTLLVTLSSAGLVAVLAATAAPASANGGNGNTGNYLCIKDSLPAQCADLLNNNPVQGQHIIIDSSTLGQGLGWNLAYEGYEVTETSPFTSGSGLNARYVGDGVYQIEKKTPTGHNGCMGAIASGGLNWLVVWEPCTSAANVDWVLSNSGYLINIDISNAEYSLTGLKNSPWGLSDQVNGTSNGSEINVDSQDNPWYYIPAP